MPSPCVHDDLSQAIRPPARTRRASPITVRSGAPSRPSPVLQSALGICDVLSPGGDGPVAPQDRPVVDPFETDASGHAKRSPPLQSASSSARLLPGGDRPSRLRLPWSDRPGASRRRALLRTGLATLAASGSSNVRRVWQSKGLRSVPREAGSSAGPLTPAIGRGV
jgi:hypothetical protein